MRIKPLDAYESKTAKDQRCIQLSDEDPTLCTVSDPRRGVEPVKLQFNHIFNEAATSVDVFDTACNPLIDAVMHGFNGTLMAYGQTCSGKTFTMGSMASYSPQVQ